MDKTQNQKCVVAIGKFDGFHIGHRRLIDRAVSLAKDENMSSVMLFIGSETPALLPDLCAFDMAKSAGIDHCIRRELNYQLKNMTAEEFVRDVLLCELGCAKVVVGYNFRFAKDRSADVNDLRHICDRYGIKCNVVDEVKMQTLSGQMLTVSSTIIRTFLSEGRAQDARAFLGRPYSLYGRVVSGKHIGTQMGVPTANIAPCEGSIIPAAGVYATRTVVDGKAYVSITNIGDNPTVNSIGNITVETNIFDFSLDIYGLDISVEFLEYIRGEIKFDSVESLSKQINKDVLYVKNKYSK